MASRRSSFSSFSVINGPLGLVPHLLPRPDDLASPLKTPEYEQRYQSPEQFVQIKGQARLKMHTRKV
jgi:hypothetical protein